MPAAPKVRAGSHAAAVQQSSLLEEIDKKRHTKNPFAGKYVDFCLSKFDQVRCTRWLQ
jgi:hypothetical protein